MALQATGGWAWLFEGRIKYFGPESPVLHVFESDHQLPADPLYRNYDDEKMILTLPLRQILMQEQLISRKDCFKQNESNNYPLET